jgi:hypothetical protein
MAKDMNQRAIALASQIEHSVARCIFERYYGVGDAGFRNRKVHEIEQWMENITRGQPANLVDLVRAWGDHKLHEVIIFETAYRSDPGARAARSIRIEKRLAMQRRRAATIYAQQENCQPAVLSESEVPAAQMPFLGTYCPDGWERVYLGAEFEPNRRGVFMGDNRGYGAYFVDASGVGTPDELPLTFGEFIRLIRPSYGYGLVEAGIFQIKIGVFERTYGQTRDELIMENEDEP